MIGELSNHLWQSTMVVAIAALVTLALRNNGAHVRHRIWVIASLKFLVPFSLLASVGGAFSFWAVSEAPLTTTSPAFVVARDVTAAVDRVAQPFAADIVATGGNGSTSGVSFGLTLFLIWATGLAAVVAMRVRGWWRVRAAIQASVPLDLPGPIPARSVRGLLEPGVVGIWRPVLLLPEGIERHLSPTQMRAVLEHEFCHIRRRDNLTSALHMVVEAVCWFHPLVWWVGARLVDERERACDEQVLRACGEPEAYAESILNVCKLYVESPLPCVSGVSGSDLKKRVTAIMAGRIGTQLTMVRQTALAIVALVMLSTPLLAGMIGGAQQVSQSRFEAVSVKPCETDTPAPQPPARPGFRSGGSPYSAMVSPGHVYWHCASLAQLIPQAYASTDEPLQNTVTTLRIEDNFQPNYVTGGPSWVTSERFTIEAVTAHEVTSVVLGESPGRALVALPPSLSQALRQVLEDRFRLRVDRATEQRDMYAMTVAPGGLKGDKITTPVPGDCQTIEQYAAAQAVDPERRTAERIAAAREGRSMCSQICGRSCTGREGDVYVMEHTSVTLDFLASHLSRNLQAAVVNRTNTSGLFNIKMGAGNSQTRDWEGFYSRELAVLGLQLSRIKGPAQHLVIKSVERLRPNQPIDQAAIGTRPW